MFLGVLYIGAFLPFFNERNVRNEALKTTLFIFSKIVSQNDFKYITNGLNHKFVVVEIDSLNAAEVYLKTLGWIKETYKNPDEVIKANFENEKIRLDGFQ
jgi:hypothetical protein